MAHTVLGKADQMVRHHAHLQEPSPVGQTTSNISRLGDTQQVASRLLLGAPSFRHSHIAGGSRTWRKSGRLTPIDTLWTPQRWWLP